MSVANKKVLDYHHNNRLINAAQQMLQKQYEIAGLQDVAQTLSMDVQSDEFVQILNLARLTLTGSSYLQLDVKQELSTCMTVGKTHLVQKQRANHITTFHRGEYN